MKICTTQIRPFNGDVAKNIRKHLEFIELAVSKGADLIFFPELSLTGYEPGLAKKLAIPWDNKRLDCFQEIAESTNIIIGLGIPTRGNSGIHISMIFFQPDKQRQVYSKQYLHQDELPYFVPGNKQLILEMKGKKIAPAICYESLLGEHAERVFQLGAEIYLASVAKSESGVKKAFRYYPKLAAKYEIPVLMSNCIGKFDNFESAGQSSLWNKKGELVAQLDGKQEGVLIFDTETEEIMNYEL